MKKYDRNCPLIFIHVPKTAGVSLRSVFRKWFGQHLYFHYADNTKGTLPVRRDLDQLHSYDNPIAVYGHFNKKREFDLASYYPDADQFLTVLREPFDRRLSLYFYLKKAGSNNYGPKAPTESLEYRLLNSKGSFLDSFPKEVTFDNYKEIIERYFIDIGVLEKLEESIIRFSNKLGFEFNREELAWANQTARDQEIPYWIKDRYIEEHRLEYAVYEYALSKYQ